MPAQAMVVGAAFVGLAWLERTRPLRPWHERRGRHAVRDLVFAASTAWVVGGIERPLAMALSRHVHRNRLGLLPRLRLPPQVESAVAVAALDYTMFVWHRLTHRVPLLWRFHAMHHVDRDLDVFTAVRFHVGEMALSVPLRLIQVGVLGIAPRPFTLWQTLMLLGIFFHHSNVRLAPRVERAVSGLFVTPRMHGVHHSVIAEQRNSNWSSGISSVWDRLHRTLRFDVRAPQPHIGLSGFESDRDVRATRMLSLPFRRRRASQAFGAVS